MKKRNDAHSNYKKKKLLTGYMAYFFRIMLWSFIPVCLVDIVLSLWLGPSYDWLLWIVDAVLLIIAGCIGLYVQGKMDKIKKENNKKNGKVLPNQEDIDIYS